MGNKKNDDDIKLETKKKNKKIDTDDANLELVDMSGLAKLTGGKLLRDTAGVKYYIDSGNLAVNLINSGRCIGGGWPGGRIIEFLGPSQGGKSFWATNAVRGCQAIGGIAIYLDCENGLNPDFAAQTSHIDPANMVRFGPADGIDCLEGVFLKVHNVIKAVRAKYPTRPLLFVYDSIAVSPSRRELNETTLSENYTDAEFKKKVGGKEQPGERAKIANKEFRKLEAVIEKLDVTMLVINQIRQKIGVLYGNPETGAGAATVLEFYASCRVRASAHKKIENTRLGMPIGINLKIKNIKNRMASPFREAEGVQLFFDKGVNPISGLLTAFEQAERIVRTGNGTYKVCDAYSGGKEVTFRGSKARNDIDPEILYQCPALVDAKDEEEVRNYLSIFGDVMSQAASEDTVEQDVADEFWSGDEDPASLA